MSYSSLYAVDKKGCGREIIEFGNSWLFSPIIWDILTTKYLRRHEVVYSEQYRIAKSMVGFGNEIFPLLNRAVNESSVISDRILWELSLQQVFFVKDKDYIHDAILKFVEDHVDFLPIFAESPPLSADHIKNRFTDAAKHIKSLDEDQFDFLIWKGTSVDDEVQRYFRKYNEEIDEYEPRTLFEFAEQSDCNVEFVKLDKEENTMSFIHYEEAQKEI